MKKQRKYYETELPEGYIAAKVVDAKDKKTVILMNIFNLIIVAALFVAIWFAVFKGESFATSVERLLVDEAWKTIVRSVVFIVLLFGYIVLHELVHGIVYKAFTKQKLTFGLTISVAYCGVPNIYVYRTAALCALLAPFVVFSIVFAVPMFFLKEYADIMICGALLAFHVGGCVGDLYDTFLYAFVFRDSTTLMRDTGPKQTFFVLKDSPLGQRVKEIIEEEAVAAGESVSTEEAENATTVDATETESSVENK